MLKLKPTDASQHVQCTSSAKAFLIKVLEEYEVSEILRQNNTAMMQQCLIARMECCLFQNKVCGAAFDILRRH